MILPDRVEVLEGMTREELIGQIHEMYEQIDELMAALNKLRDPILFTIYRGDQKLQEFESYEICRAAVR